MRTIIEIRTPPPHTDGVDSRRIRIVRDLTCQPACCGRMVDRYLATEDRPIVNPKVRRHVVQDDNGVCDHRKDDRIISSPFYCQVWSVEECEQKKDSRVMHLTPWKM